MPKFDRAAQHVDLLKIRFREESITPMMFLALYANKKSHVINHNVLIAFLETNT